MSRRDDFLATLHCALQKDHGVSVAGAMRVLQAAYALPDEVWPVVTAHDVAQFCRWAIQEGEPPAWVVEHLENECEVAQVVQEQRRTVSMVMSGANTRWYDNVLALHCHGGDWVWDELPVGLKRLYEGNCKAQLTQREIDDLLEWASMIQGYDDETFAIEDAP